MSLRDYSLDFIKGIAILSVILIHCFKDQVNHGMLYWFHIGQAVPLFMLVSGYLTYQRAVQPCSVHHFQVIRKSIQNILYPFFLITLLQIYIKLKINAFNAELLLEQMGLGPGSYYPWIFIQAVIFMPFLVSWTQKQSSGWKGWWKIIAFSILLNVGLSEINLDATSYRLLIVRYIPYLYLGCWWAKEGFKFSKSLLLLVFISGIFAFAQMYLDLQLEPIVFKRWKTYSWLTAPYVLGIAWILKVIYFKFKSTTVVHFVSWMGKHSYSIFLMQLLVFSILRRRYLSFVEAGFERDFIFFIIGLTLSLAPILLHYLWHLKFNTLKK